MEVLGIDIGGSGIKGAPVETETGELLAERYRLPTPEPSKPEQVADAVAQIAGHFDWHGPVGCGFPSALQNGIVMTAANISKKWIGVNASELFSQTTGCPVVVLNDADVAGIAEMTFGAGRGRNGVVLIVTIGTGLGTALFTQGKLLPNAELGHVELNGSDAEQWASDAARKRDHLSWKKWAGRFDVYLKYLESLFWPELIILGGGASKKFDKFGERLTVQAEVVPAQLLNEAGIVGAALAAYQQLVVNELVVK
jgi:polyphosphate glucokinase